MFRDHACQRERLACVPGRKRVMSAEWMEAVRAFMVDRPAPANHVFERVRDNSRGDGAGRNRVQRGAFRARILEKFAVNIKRADYADGILVSKRLDAVKNILHRAISTALDRMLQVLIENRHRPNPGGDATEH